jgi:ribosomal protein S18 acetylase RimI-like enzyme
MTGTRSARVTVRAATVKDLDTVVALRVALLREHPENPVYRRLRHDVTARARRLFAQQLDSPGEVTFLAERGGQAVGILRCVESSGSPLLLPAQYAYVSSVYVLPEARRSGVLTALMEHAEGWAREAGLEEFRLHSVADSPAANGAWDALGFEIVEHLRTRSVNG